nr:MAG TPA: hypothetical protein [Bacteriophage sp.]
MKSIQEVLENVLENLIEKNERLEGTKDEKRRI